MIDFRVNLYEFASLLKELGLVNAINLDGGGSATTVVNDTLRSYPSDSWYVFWSYWSVQQHYS